MPRRTALGDLASKEDADHLVRGLRWPSRTGPADVDHELAVLMRRAPCPVWTVQPWASRTVRFAVAVVGVDPSREARTAAHVAKEMLQRSETRPRLLLVHRLEEHPAQIAATQALAGNLRLDGDRAASIERLASERSDPDLLVEWVAGPSGRAS